MEHTQSSVHGIGSVEGLPGAEVRITKEWLKSPVKDENVTYFAFRVEGNLTVANGEGMNGETVEEAIRLALHNLVRNGSRFSTDGGKTTKFVEGDSIEVGVSVAKSPKGLKSAYGLPTLQDMEDFPPLRNAHKEWVQRKILGFLKRSGTNVPADFDEEAFFAEQRAA